MEKTPKINLFFKRANVSPTEDSVGSSVDHVTVDTPNPPTKIQRIDTVEFNINSLKRDPRLRKQIWDYPINRRDEVRRAYIILHGPNRPDLGKKIPVTLTSSNSRPRRFQAPLFALFSWLEYPVTKNKTFCFPCFLFSPPDGSGFVGHTSFFVEGFDSWRKVNSGKACSFRLHECVNYDSCHQIAQQKWKKIQNLTQNIERAVVKFSAEKVFYNRIRLKISIDLVRRLAFQALPFRRHDEKSTSNNCGNCLEFYDLLASYNEEVIKTLINVPNHVTYKSSDIQKEILHIFSTKVKEAIREEIGHAKFCIIVNEARDASKKE